MKRYRLNILGISETHYKGQRDIVSNDIEMVYSGEERCERGVAILFDKEAAERITGIEKISDRLMMVKVSAEPVDMVLIQVYMPTMKYEDEEVEQIYDQIEDIIRRQKVNTNVIVMGDFNARVGEGRYGK